MRISCPSFFKTAWPAVVLGLTIVLTAADFGPGHWQQLKGRHFEVFYGAGVEETMARAVLNRAEEYYQRIGDRIGYVRRDDYWTWEERAKIVIFPDQLSFTAATGQPAWTSGFSGRDYQLFKSRTIVTFRQETHFIDGLLPHEISHLVVHDYIPEPGRLPVWFDEGVAQLEEAGKSASVAAFMKAVVARGWHVDFASLTRWDIRGEQDPQKVKLFYSQSLSVVEFMIREYGQAAFSRFFRELRAGKDFEAALQSAYTTRIRSLADLERLWLKSFNR